MSTTVLQVANLSKQFPGVLALDNVSFDLQAGEIHALCGENGAGKSTLIKCLSGVWPAGSYQGEIQVNGQPVRFHNIKEAEQAGIAVIYQELALVSEMTVAENIFLGVEPCNAWGKIDWHKVYAQTQALLVKYKLTLDPAAKVKDLGIGQQQLVEIVKALAKNAKILLLDEPTAALTETEVEILLGIIKTLKAQNVTCVYISHKLDEVFAIADRITVLRDGSSIATQVAADSSKPALIQQMVGRSIDEQFPRRAAATGDEVLRVQDLSVVDAQTGKPILSTINFTVKAGEVLGFGGLMGAGRTELIMHLFGVAGVRKQGQVTFLGKPFDQVSPQAAIKAGMMMVSEDRKRYGLVLDKDIGFNQSLASLFNIKRGLLINESKETHLNQQFFDTLRIKAPGLESVVGGLSGGNQQKVVLAKALMTEPSLVFLDEPTRGIDVGAKLEVYELINRLTAEGKAVILISSELPELMGMSDRIIVLSEGQIGGEFIAQQVEQQTLLEAAMRYS